VAKIISIIVTVTLVALGFWVTAEPWVNSSIKFADWHVWILPATFLVLLSTVTAIAYMLLPQKRLKMLVASLIGGTFLAVFGFWYLDILAFFVILLFHLFAIRYIQFESRERLKIHVGQIIKRGIGTVMIPLYIALSFAYYSSPSIQVRAQNADLAPNLKQVVSEVASKFLATELNQIPEEQREAASSYAIERTYNYFVSYFEPYREYFPPVLAFGLFLILVGLGFILHRLSIWLGMGIFWVLYKSKFVFIEKKQIEAESIALCPQTTTKP
jgi:hypothetical protein